MVARTLERDLEREIQNHLACEVRQEDVREAWDGRGWSNRTRHPFRMAQVRRNPSFSVIAIGTLALGWWRRRCVRAVDAVLIRPLPYVGEERLVTLWDGLSMSRTREPKSSRHRSSGSSGAANTGYRSGAHTTGPGRAYRHWRARQLPARKANGISAVFWESSRWWGGRSAKTKTTRV